MNHSHTDRDAQFWQTLEPADTYELNPANGYQAAFPAQFNDGRQLLLPIRARDNGRSALASLIINQASFSVVDALATDLAAKLATEHLDLLIGIPTLGLTLAEATARKLGHTRYLPLGTSRKFWYDDALSSPLSSVTSPDQQKRLYIDPRLLALLENRRIALIDDVVSTGSSMSAALSLLALCHAQPVCLGCAMRQTQQWQDTLPKTQTDIEYRVHAAIDTPRLLPNSSGGWVAEE